MHGICKVMNISKDYLEYFDIVYEVVLELTRKSQYFLQDVNASYCVFRFFKELVENRNERISFSIYDSYGIIIFKSISPILIQYGK